MIILVVSTYLLINSAYAHTVIIFFIHIDWDLFVQWISNLINNLTTWIQLRISEMLKWLNYIML